jgi:hypothetical protein
MTVDGDFCFLVTNDDHHHHHRTLKKGHTRFLSRPRPMGETTRSFFGPVWCGVHGVANKKNQTTKKKNVGETLSFHGGPKKVTSRSVEYNQWPWAGGWRSEEKIMPGHSPNKQKTAQDDDSAAVAVAVVVVMDSIST